MAGKHGEQVVRRASGQACCPDRSTLGTGASQLMPKSGGPLAWS